MLNTLFALGLAATGLAPRADSTTLVPVLMTPVAGATIGVLMNVSYQLPENAKAGTARLTFTNATTGRAGTIVLAASASTAGRHDVVISAGAPTSSAAVASGDPVPGGTYDVRLSYQDAAGNPPASAMVRGVILKTATAVPRLLAPATGTTVGGPMTISYILPEAPKAGTVSITFTNLTTGASTILVASALGSAAGTPVSFTIATSAPLPSAYLASGAAIADGAYDVSLSYQGRLGNPPVTAHSSFVTVSTKRP